MPAAKGDPKAAVQDGENSQASRAMSLASYFFSGLLGINASQFIGAPLWLINKDWYNSWMAFTKESFGLLTMTMTQSFAPTVMKISGDASVRGQLRKDWNGNLRCSFPDRLVLIANHQIYTDWLYLWWIAYTNGMHGRIHIVLKESLKNIPVLGWGMQFSQFIFMKRNWEKDKPHMAEALQDLNQKTKPMWLMLFPEGTNLSPQTREVSQHWAQKTGQKDMQHVLLPRHTGLLFCLQELRKTVEYVYDCTVAYEGVKRGQYAQDVFTIKSSYLEGKPPKSVSMYWRRFPLSKIPLNDEKLFERWLRARWAEKDSLLEYYHRVGEFPADTGVQKLPNGIAREGCGHLEVPLKATQWYEFLQIFAPMGVLALVLSVFYGALPQSLLNIITKQAGLPPALSDALTKANSTTASGFSLDSILDGEKSEEVLKFATTMLMNSLESPNPQTLTTTTPTPAMTNFYEALQEEEARRSDGKPKTAPQSQKAVVKKGSPGQNSSNPATAAPPKKTTPASGDFWQNLEARQNKTQTKPTAQPKEATSMSGNFWKDLEARQSKDQPKTTAQPKQTKSASGDFWQNLEVRQNQGKPRVASPPKKATPLPGNFWQDMKSEQTKRNGSVITASSQATSTMTKTTQGTATPTPRKAQSVMGQRPTPVSRAASVVSAPAGKPSAPRKLPMTPINEKAATPKPLAKQAASGPVTTVNGVKKATPAAASKNLSEKSTKTKPIPPNPTKIVKDPKAIPTSPTSAKKPVTPAKKASNLTKPTTKPVATSA